MRTASAFEIGDVVYRHGDILLKKADQKAKGKTLKSVLLHKGDNHHHVLKGGEFKVEEGKGPKLLLVKKQTTLTHEEHGPIKVSPGAYQIEIQNEYDHWLKESRKVID